MSVEAILKGKTLPTKEFCEVLVNEVKAGHARMHHPFYLDLYGGKLPLESIRIWAKEAWAVTDGVARECAKFETGVKEYAPIN